jgi:hypothetical protein
LAGNTGQCATALMAFLATLAMWSQQVAHPKGGFEEANPIRASKPFKNSYLGEVLRFENVEGLASRRTKSGHKVAMRRSTAENESFIRQFF